MGDFHPAVIDAWLDLVNYLPAAHPLLVFAHHQNPIVVGIPPFALPFHTVDTPPPSPKPQGPAEMDIDDMDIDEMDIEMESSVDTPPPSPTPAPFPHPLWGDADEYDPVLQAAVAAEFALVDIVVGGHVAPAA